MSKVNMNSFVVKCGNKKVMDWKGKMMKMLWKAMFITLVFVLFTLVDVSHAAGDSTNLSNGLNSLQNQNTVVQGQGYASADPMAEGGDSDSTSISYSEGSNSGAIANISSTSINKTRLKTAPLSTIPPYLPYWQHGGWGTLKAYFPNGPSNYDDVYERTFNPSDPDDMRELKGILNPLPYSGILEALNGMLNKVCVVFGGPDNFHRGKGFEIASALVRERRPEGKPLLALIDSNIDRKQLDRAGYAYVGKISLEGKVERNWDQVYDAAVAEAMPWDVDILLISGGMKGVTVGSNKSFPGSALGYSHTSYSLSLMGTASTGITEGKGKAMVSAEAYRYWPQAVIKRRIPKSFYDRIHIKKTAMNGQGTIQTTSSAAGRKAGVRASQEILDLAGLEGSRQIQNLIVD